MKLIRGIHNLRLEHQGCVLTIGNFDAVHLGHRAVLSQVVNKAKELGLSSCVMLFEPQPREFFSLQAGTLPLPRLASFREKVTQLEKLGIDQVLVVNFNQNFANLSAENFIDDLLVKKLDVNLLVVGDDFRFGAKQQGDFGFLTEYAPFDVMNTKSFQIEVESKIRVSSTAIRASLAKGELAVAKAMLGRDFSIVGRVTHGQKLGRTINFPTANIPLKRLRSPVMGVFAVRVLGVAKTALNGVANVGIRPTVNGKKPRLEVHLFNFENNLYGKQLEVQFLHKLRDEQTFDSLAALKRQIEQDALTAYQWLENN